MCLPLCLCLCVGFMSNADQAFCGVFFALVHPHVPRFNCRGCATSVYVTVFKVAQIALKSSVQLLRTDYAIFHA
jgi:hypothetical protein